MDCLFNKGKKMVLDLIPFGSFKEIEPNIVEMTFDDGVELDRAKLSVVATGLCEKYREPYAVLANRHNSYFHTDSSLDIYSKLSNLKGMAFLVRKCASSENGCAGKTGGNSPKTFQDRDEAILWLRETLTQA